VHDCRPFHRALEIHLDCAGMLFGQLNLEFLDVFQRFLALLFELTFFILRLLKLKLSDV
jgi:hypothetical protein